MENMRLEALKILVATFERKYDEVTAQSYNEDNLRVDFVDKFFKEVLGWDVGNKNQDSEQFREVYREDKVYVKGKHKAPDYSFRIGETKIFFLETKKPFVKIEKDPQPALQLRWYGHSANMGISILTNFENFIIYDTRITPKSKDSPQEAVWFSCHYKDYEKNLDFLYNSISKEAVRQGKLKALLGKEPKGSQSVDDGILKLIEGWRKSLAINIAKKNKDIDIYSLNQSVQKIIDRIMFLRIAEDRGIENYKNLFNIISQPAIYKHLTEYFEKANKKYNSGLFDTDEPLNALNIDNDIMEDIITDIYFPKHSYEFSYIPTEILGNIYEQFLGKVIHLTPSHSAKVVDKPEVKKNKGVFYTPQYIVEYIVKNTVAEKIKDKTPKDIEKLRILDPACGSGSFLIGAYTCLLTYHLSYYKKTDKNVQKALKEGRIYGAENEYSLSIQEKQNILLNNIYGVDVDSQAVEVSKLSLLLKLMEGENQESIGQFFTHSDLKPLPNLKDNIKCGNSLIASDFYEGKLIAEIPKGEIHEINAFDWAGKDGFPEIMESGFDVVIGNPPWVFTRDVDFGKNYKKYIQNTYLDNLIISRKGKTGQSGKINLYAIFLMKGIKLLSQNGVFSFILPNNILRTTVYDIVRKYILDNCRIKEIVDLKAGVFHGVTASTAILIIENNANNQKNEIKIIDNNTPNAIDSSNISLIPQIAFKDNTSYSFNIFVSLIDEEIFSKIRDKSSNLGELVNVYNGIATKKGKEGIFNKPINSKCKPLLFGKDIHRYQPNYNNKYIEYDKGKLHRARNENIFLSKEKLVMQRIGGILITSYDDKQYYTFNSVNNLIPKDDCPYSIKFILGLINSKLMKFYYVKNFTNKSTLTVNISKTYLDKLPIIKMDIQKGNSNELHDNLVVLVDQMLGFQKQCHSTNNEGEKQSIRKQSDDIDDKIDELVYDLYSLTDEERKIVDPDYNK